MNSFLLAIVFMQAGLGLHPRIDVVYPRPTANDSLARIGDVEYNFIFGSVQPPSAQLLINNIPVNLHANGAFLAYLPVSWSSQEYQLLAYCGADSSSLTLPFATYPPWQGTLSPPEVNFPAVLTLRKGVLRTDPNGAYYIFNDDGVRITSTEWRDDYFRVPLYDGQSVWVQSRYVLESISNAEVAPEVLHKAKIETDSQWESLVLPMEQPKLFLAEESISDYNFSINIFGVTSHLDYIALGNNSRLIENVQWSQPHDGHLKLTFQLSQPLWGYSVEHKNGALKIKLRKPPHTGWRNHGLHVAIDAGHGGDNKGAIGPTRLMEKDINLLCARALAERLERSGATVTMIREDDNAISLRSRVKMAGEASPDILVSLHHNALPDGVNPFGEYGTTTFYYHPQARDLAWEIQRALVNAFELPDEGIAYNNLALSRPTAMPAVLVEIGYIMLPDQEALMQTVNYPDRVARAITLGIGRFVHKRSKHK